MKSRFLFIALLVLLVTIFAAPTLAQDEAACPAGPVAEDAPVIKFGAAISDTGRYAREGTDTRNGYTLWLEWVNEEHGGINVAGTCHRAEIIFYDDESDPDTVSLLTER